MKRIIFLFAVGVLFSQHSFAKKVKFSVDMTDQTIAPLGVHVAGNFQEAAGYPGGDYTSNSIEMLKEGNTNIYSVVVDLPAPAMYEYTFINGDQWYEVEFVPMESRIGYDDNAFRWIYINNAAPADTATTGAILFSGNAPTDKFLVRLFVDMTNEVVSTNGVHVAGNYQNWNLTETPMYPFVENMYEAIVFMPAGANEYKFFNGSTTASAETIPASCASNTNRTINVSSDIVTDAVCFSSCNSCSSSAVPTTYQLNAAALYPSISSTYSLLKQSENLSNYTVIISDFSGRIVRIYKGQTNNTLIIKKANLSSGIYSVRTIASDNSTLSINKLIFK